MTEPIAETSQRQAAVIAGCGLLVMLLFYLFADMVVLQNLLVPGDATATAKNIMASEVLFRIGIWSLLIVLVCDVVVAWALYVFLRQAHKSLSLLAAWFRLVYAGMLGFALICLVVVLILLSGGNYLTLFQTDQVHVQVLLLFNAFYSLWGIGLIVFGAHLLILGYVAYRSDYVPGLLGVLLMLAGVSYLIDYSGRLLFPTFDLESSLVIGWGELVFMVWLLWKGGKRPAGA